MTLARLSWRLRCACRGAPDDPRHAPDQAWKRRSCGNGSKGPESTTGRPPPCPKTAPSRPAGPHYLQVRRSLTRNAKDELELAYYLCAAPAGTEDEKLICVAGARWAAGECFQSAKNEAGLDHYQVRRCDAWYRHPRDPRARLPRRHGGPYGSANVGDGSLQQRGSAELGEGGETVAPRALLVASGSGHPPVGGTAPVPVLGR